MEKNRRRWLILVGIIVIIVAFSVTFTLLRVVYTAYEVEKYDLRNYVRNVTKEDILFLCNKTDDYDKIICLNNIYSQNVEYDISCLEGRSYTLMPVETINLGKGCCKDAALYYKYFLGEYGIYYQRIDFPHHVWIEAAIYENGDYKNGTLKRIVVLDQDYIESRVALELEELNVSKEDKS